MSDINDIQISDKTYLAREAHERTCSNFLGVLAHKFF